MSWTEISNRAEQFSKKWQDRLAEKGAGFLEIANTQTFYDEFFEIFGRDRSSVANHEENVRLKDREDKHPKRIDLLWPGVLLIEQKSPHTDRKLDAAYKQAMEYVENLCKSKCPRYIMISDFNVFELYDGEVCDREKGLIESFSLSNLPKHVKTFDFMLNFNMTPRLQSKYICDKYGNPMPGPILRSICKNARWLLLVIWTIGVACGLVWSNATNSQRSATNPSLNSTKPVSSPSHPLPSSISLK